MKEKSKEIISDKNINPRIIALMKEGYPQRKAINIASIKVVESKKK